MPENPLASTQFNGFPVEVFSFLEGLERDNSKSYWEANKDTWATVVKPTIRSLMDALEPDFGPLRTFRPNRDVRFSADKSPYKTWLGVTTTDRALGGIGSFVQVTSSGIELAAGAMMLASDQLARYREALVSGRAGEEFDQIRSKLATRNLTVGPGEMAPYKRYPSGYPKGHERSQFLLWKGAIVIRRHERSGWMHTREMLPRVHDVWGGAKPLVDWFRTHVGESEIPPSRPRP